jgi:nitrogen regulatory protein PII
MSEQISKASDREPSKPAPLPVIKLLFFIIDWSKTGVISSVFEEEKVRFHFISKGRGTASSEILDLLGIGASEKAVILCLEQNVLVPVLLREVRKKLGFHSPGAGIAFTVPLSGINNPILQVFKESILKNEKIAVDNEGGTMPGEIKNDLIIAIINQGYCDEFMTAAREAGATGGTVINARGLAHQGPVKFFGVSVQDEKEIIIILTGREKKTPIMQAVSQAYGIASAAGGIVFSLPVDSVMGLSFE